ncbi:MAG: pilin [Pseudoxanthomonas sp.]
MSEWYYASGHDRRLGPLSSNDLVTEFRQGRIGLETLVWREGQPQWQPLADFSSELGLTGDTGSVLPPPLPVGPVRAPQTFAPQPKSGLSGCMIALIVVAVLAIPVIGILAAIAVPAYQQYVVRAKVAGALPVAEVHKAAVSSYLAREQACPGNGDTGFEAPERYAQGSVASLTFGKFESDLCGMEVILAVPGTSKVDGKALWLEYNPADASWHCSSEIEDKYLPAQCRG